MGKILRAFQVIKQDGGYFVSSTYNTVDESGNITARNKKDSFFVVDEGLEANIKAVEDYINNRLAGE